MRRCLTGKSFEDNGHAFGIVEAAEFGDERNGVAGFGEQPFGLIYAELAEHFPRGAAVMFFEFSLNGAAGDAEFVAHRSDADGVLHSIGKVRHDAAEQGIVDGKVIGGVAQDHSTGLNESGTFTGVGFSGNKLLHGFSGSGTEGIPGNGDAGKHRVSQAANEFVVVGAND